MSLAYKILDNRIVGVFQRIKNWMHNTKETCQISNECRSKGCRL